MPGAPGTSGEKGDAGLSGTSGTPGMRTSNKLLPLTCILLSTRGMSTYLPIFLIRVTYT